MLEIVWPDGARHELPAEYLRVESPSAEVKGHGPGQAVLVHGRRHVGVLRLEPVGNYALRIVFDDLHDSGLYTWANLRALGEERADRWARYLAALAERGLSRDPPARRGAAASVPGGDGACRTVTGVATESSTAPAGPPGTSEQENQKQ